MDKKSLVVLRSSNGLILETDTLYPNKVYRCMELTENGRSEYMVYGIIFDQEEFDKLFEYAYDRVVRDFTEIGLIVNDKLISKAGFTKLADIHTYQSMSQRRNKHHVAYFRGRETLYGFYPCFNDTKANTMSEAYGNLVKFFNGDLLRLDQEDIQFGNKGIPLGGGKIGSWFTK